MQDPAHPGESLRDALADAGWTVTEAAAKLGCARQTFSRLLNGRTGISPGMALALERRRRNASELRMAIAAVKRTARDAREEPPAGPLTRQALEGFVRAEATDAPTRRG